MITVFAPARSLPNLMKLVFLLGGKAASAGQLCAVTSSFVVKELSQFLT